MFNTFKTKLTSNIKGALTKDSHRVDIDCTITISSTFKNLFTWMMIGKDGRKSIKENSLMMDYLMSGHLRLELCSKVNLEDIDNFKFNLPNTLRKAFEKAEMSSGVSHKFLKINNINMTLPEGAAKNLAEKRKDRNNYLDEILNL